MEAKSIIRTAAISGAAAVALGAFGAHGLEQMVTAGKLSADDLDAWKTANTYQFYHTLALLFIGLGWSALHARRAGIAAWAMIAGICIFSGSLYLLTLSEPLFGTRMSWLGAITPLGGLSFIAGWVCILLAVRRP